MIPDQYTNILNNLLHKSRNGQVNWLSTADDKEFLVQFSSFSLSIRIWWDEFNSTAEIMVKLRDNSGNVLDTFSEGEDGPGWSLLEELFGAARRKALRIDEAIGEIEKELEVDDQVGADRKARRANRDDDIPF